MEKRFATTSERTTFCFNRQKRQSVPITSAEERGGPADDVKYRRSSLKGCGWECLQLSLFSTHLLHFHLSLPPSFPLSLILFVHLFLYFPLYLSFSFLSLSLSLLVSNSPLSLSPLLLLFHISFSFPLPISPFLSLSPSLSLFIFFRSLSVLLFVFFSPICCH